MATYNINLNSFQVEANSEDEAIAIAEQMLKDDVSNAYPLEAVLEE